MLRSVLGAIVGYLVIAIIAILGTAVSWSVLGPVGAFEGDGPYPSTPWIAANLVLSLAAAFVGGWVAVRLGRSGLAVKILLAIVLVLGLGLAFAGQRVQEDPGPPPKPVSDLSFFEAGQYARQPNWYNWMIPVVGAVGVALGGLRRP